MHSNRFLLAVCPLLAALATGCQREQPQSGPSEALAIPVSHPVSREVTDYVDYTGRTAAVESVDVRARVTGYLIKISFKEGREVKKGDVLFEIDPRPYQAQVDATKAQVTLNEANQRLAQANYGRSRAIAARDPSAISREELETSQATEAQASAMLGVAKANLNSAQLNLDFTKITAPIDGQISRYYLTIGNLVTQDQTLLTTVVSPDPMYAYFDMDEPTLLRIKRAINTGKIKLPREDSDIPILMGLQGEESYPHRGSFNFINNVVNPSTGTIAVRGVFPNPRPTGGTRLLAPGMFVRIRLPIGDPHQALLVIDRALGSDQGLKFVYVLDAEHKVQYRRVTQGPLQDDGLRVIEEGLKLDDWVVVGGLPQLRPRMQVQPDEVPMPSLAADTQTPGAAGKPQPPPPGEHAPQQQAGPNKQ